MNRYHRADVSHNLLPYCNFSLCPSADGSGDWQHQRLSCPGLLDFVLKSLAAAPHIPVWEPAVQDFHQGILWDIFFGFLNTSVITFVNIAFFLSHVPLQGKSGTRALASTTISPQGHCWKPTDFCFIKVSEKTPQGFRKKKLPTDRQFLSWVSAALYPSSTQPST